MLDIALLLSRYLPRPQAIEAIIIHQGLEVINAAPVLDIVLPIPMIVTIHAAQITEVFSSTRKKYVLCEHRIEIEKRSNSVPVLDILSIVDIVLTDDPNARMPKNLLNKANEDGFLVWSPVAFE